MAQDAELKLKVSLDLAYFRGQLSRLPLETAGYSAPINLRIDNRSILNELRRVDKIFAKRNYNLQVNDTAIKAARTNAQKLKNTLDLLQRTKYTIDIGTRQTGASIEDLQNLFSRGKSGQVFGAGAVGQARGNVARQALLERLEKKSLSAGGYNVAGLKRVVEELGGTPSGGRSQLAAQAKDLAQKADDALIDRVYASVKDLQMNMKYAGGGGYGVGQSISKMINQMSLASSDPFAARQKLRQLPPKYITTEMAGRATEQAMANEALGQKGAPVSSKFQNSFDKYLDAVVSQAMADASIARQRFAERTSPLRQLTPTVPPRQYFQATGIPLLPSAGQTSGAQPAPRMLPAAGGTGGYFNAGNRPGGGFVPPGGFPTEGMLGGKAGPATFIGAGSSIEKFKTAIDIANASTRNFRASSLPLIGGLKEIGGEFLNATKQVLLYGTAYKGLAFITSLPGQILNAAKGQQQFNNALQTATQDTGTFAKELLYVDNVQRAFGLNLETTRTGFTKLYASMAPTGFDSGSIEKLFTGISAATAALQLTPDKAERVIYAFGQMASKGQIMSEELKGQLGDVLPGALAIFAKAAGMSVKEFSQAMEDGVFVGGKFREVFAKVSDELMNRFGTGAQAAGRSLQGLLNTVQGDFKRTLESFSPLANIAAQAILGPLSNALRQLSKSAQIAMGEMERIQGQIQAGRQDVSALRQGGASAEQIQAAERNVAALELRYRSLNEALKDPAVAQQVKSIQLFTQELVKAGTFVMNMARTIGSMLAPAINFLGTNLTTVIATLTSFYIGFQAARLAAMTLMGVLMLYRGLSVLLGFGAAAQQATALAGAFNILGVSASATQIQVVGLRLALTALVATTVIGAVVAGIVAIAGAFATMGDKARDAAQASRDASKAAIEAAQTGNVAAAAMSVQTVLAESRKAQAARKTLQAIYARSTKEQRQGVSPMEITPAESVALQGSALTSGLIQAGVSRGGVRQIRVPSRKEMTTLMGQFGSLAGQQAINLQEAKTAQSQAEQVSQSLGMNKPSPTAGSTMAEDEGDTGNKKLADYLSKRSELLQKLGEVEKNRIDLIAGLSTEERVILQAQQAFINENQVNDRKYIEDQAKANDYSIATRGKYLADLKESYLAERKIIAQRRDLAVLSPLLRLEENLINQNEELLASLNALKQGRSELNAVDRAALEIGKQQRAAAQLNIKLGQGQINNIYAQATAQVLLNNKIKYGNRVKNLREEIALLRAINDEERKRLEIEQENPQATEEQKRKIFELQTVRDNLKQVRELVDSFVTDTSSDYKGFLKAVISGEDAADALQQFQEGLSDRVLTIFLDFTMKPVEDFFKNVAGSKLIESLFPKSEEEKQKEAIKTPMDANTEATKTNTTAIDNLTAAIGGTGGTAASPTGLQSNVFAYAQGAPSFVSMDKSIFQSAQSFASQGGGNGPLSAFAYETTGFADSLNQTVDSIKTTTENSKAAGTGFVESLGGVVQGIGMLAGAAMGIVGGIQQMQKGGTKNTLAGIGSILMGVGGAIGGFMNLGKMGKAANGAVWQGGFQAFANGGMVSGPTLGLIGEGKYNEAIVPLPNGKAIPVQLNSDSIREKMSGSSNGGSVVSPMLSMNFETTTINNVEYVSRDQLERAMMETRKLATRDGARQGANLAIDKLQQSPTTRRKIGI